MKIELLDYLSCPKCKASLGTERSDEIDSSGDTEEIISGMLACANGHRFHIAGGVPRMVLSELSGHIDIHTGVKFSESWQQFSRFHQDYIKQFFDWLAPIDSSFVRDKVVLDAGCGKGRHARVVAESGAQTVIAVDIGPSVDVAFHNLRSFKNIHVVQGDIKALPFKPEFDLVYSTGVLHHMENPKLGFTSLSKILSPDGVLAVWVYGKENNNWITTLINPIREAITSKLPRAVLRVISIFLALVVFVASKAIYAPWHWLRSRVRFLPSLFYEAYLVYISRFDFEEIDHIVYDHLVAPVAFYLPLQTLKDWLADSDFVVSTIRWHNQNSWTLIGSRKGSDRQKLAPQGESSQSKSPRQFLSV